MKKLMALLICLFIPTQASASEIPLSPVTPQCLALAAKRYRVPYDILFAVLATERGKVGEVSKNRNGTVDLGPMQINTVHFDDARRWGLTKEHLKNNGCANVLFGTWYLATLLDKYRDPWEAIGVYHSRTPYHKRKYQNRAWKRLNALNLRELLAEINAPVAGWKLAEPKPRRHYDPYKYVIRD